jgi:hypothetical protein
LPLTVAVLEVVALCESILAVFMHEDLFEAREAVPKPIASPTLALID